MKIVRSKMCVAQMLASRASVFSRVMRVWGFYSERAELLLRAFANLVQLKSQKVSLWSFNLKNTVASVLYQILLHVIELCDSSCSLSHFFTLFSFCLWKIPWTSFCLCFLSYISSSPHWQCLMAWVLLLCWNLSCISNFVFM